MYLHATSVILCPPLQVSIHNPHNQAVYENASTLLRLRQSQSLAAKTSLMDCTAQVHDSIMQRILGAKLKLRNKVSG